MSFIQEKFSKLASRNEKALIAYFTCGYPDAESNIKIFEDIATSGADIIEVGVPFSDPLADGKTIQRASATALKNGFRVEGVFKVCSFLKKKFPQIPLVAMTYYNIVLRGGEGKFLERLGDSGVDGILIPDLPPEESDDIRNKATTYNMDMIFLIAPTTPLQRAKLIDSVSSGFVYYVSVTGVTGARDKLPEDIISKLSSLKDVTSNPLVVGFGVSKPEQVRRLIKFSDGVVVGSAILDRVDRGDDIKGFIKSLKAAMK